MSKELTINLLKKHFDQLWPESEEVYEKIAPYLTIHKYAKGTVLRLPGEVESTARFVYSGTATLFCPQGMGGNTGLGFLDGVTLPRIWIHFFLLTPLVTV